jgi:hypothetical protein
VIVSVAAAAKGASVEVGSAATQSVDPPGRGDSKPLELFGSRSTPAHAGAAAERAIVARIGCVSSITERASAPLCSI